MSPRSSFPDRSPAFRFSARSLLAGCFALATCAVSAEAAAYCRTTICGDCGLDDNGCPSGKPIAWPTSCVTYSMQFRASKQVDLASATEVMERAFAAWQGVSCADTSAPPAIAIDHRYGNVACDLHEYNQTDANANIVMFRDDVWPYEAPGTVLALTTVTYSSKSGAIFDADMEINSTHVISVGDPVPPTSYDLQSIVTHEAGHFLGLAHSLDPMATMWPQYAAGTMSFRMLAADDAAGICAVYPSATPAKCDYSPRQGFATECGIFPSGGAGHCSIGSRGPGGQVGNTYRWLGLASVAAAVLGWRRRHRAHAVGR